MEPIAASPCSGVLPGGDALRRVLQGEGLFYMEFKLSGANPAEYVAGTLQEFLAASTYNAPGWDV